MPSKTSARRTPQAQLRPVITSPPQENLNNDVTAQTDSAAKTEIDPLLEHSALTSLERIESWEAIAMDCLMSILREGQDLRSYREAWIASLEPGEELPDWFEARARHFLDRLSNYRLVISALGMHR
jgi:hypothetical protein